MANTKISDMSALPTPLGTDKVEVSTAAGPATFSSDRDQGVSYTQDQFVGTDPINYVSSTGTYSLNINATNLQVSGSDLNTIQDIDVTATPKWRRVNVNGLTGTISIGGVTVDSTVYIQGGGFPELDFTMSCFGGGIPIQNYTFAQGTPAAPTIVANGLSLGGSRWFGYDGATHQQGAEISCKVDGTPGVSDIPTRIIFFTKEAAVPGIVERMTLKNDGKLGIGTPTPDDFLHVADASENTRIKIENTGVAGGNRNAGFIQKNSDLEYFTGISMHSGSEQYLMFNNTKGEVRFVINEVSDNIGISDNGATFVPDASAVLELNSTTRGFLPPQMTTAQRTGISTPAAALKVYDTDLNQEYLYNGTSWVITG